MTSKTRKVIGEILFYLVAILLVFILLGQYNLLPYKVISIYSASMVPTFNAGDAVLVRIDDKLQPKVGDIILFREGNSNVVHRVYAIQDGKITTKGDANNGPDPVTITQAKGLFLFPIPLLGYPFVFVQNYWLLIIIVGAILYGVIYLYKHNIFPFTKEEEKK